MSSNITFHHHKISKADREKLKNQKAVLFWLTGLSGSGKSTIANRLEEKLFNLGKHTYILDGDNIRFGLNSDLGFSEKDRKENIRRIGEVAKLFVDAGIIVITAFISPFRKDRERVRKLFPNGEFVEIFVDTPLEICKKRDPKGLYQKVERGEIHNFTGIDSPYEKPENPEIYIDTTKMDIEEATNIIIRYYINRYSGVDR
ncbi:MAG TPA: adenylyl-sulfate kinase [Campylobacterales bacterium]|nr:adenylyl-sulfate kinase [Campylobacterales bacterium]